MLSSSSNEENAWLWLDAGNYRILNYPQARG